MAESQLPEGITQDDLDKLAKIDSSIKKLEKAKAPLLAKVKTAFVKLGTFAYGNVIIERTQAKSFDAKTFEEEHPFESFPEFYKPVIDATTIPEDEKEKYTSFTQRLSIKTVSE